MPSAPFDFNLIRDTASQGPIRDLRHHEAVSARETRRAICVSRQVGGRPTN